MAVLFTRFFWVYQQGYLRNCLHVPKSRGPDHKSLLTFGLWLRSNQIGPTWRSQDSWWGSDPESEQSNLRLKFRKWDLHIRCFMEVQHSSPVPWHRPSWGGWAVWSPVVETQPLVPFLEDGDCHPSRPSRGLHPPLISTHCCRGMLTKIYRTLRHSSQLWIGISNYCIKYFLFLLQSVCRRLWWPGRAGSTEMFTGWFQRLSNHRRRAVFG